MSEPPRVTVVEKVSCSTVPYIELGNKEIDLLLSVAGLEQLIIDIDKQSRIIDDCKK